jgi:hypothetical protein
MEGSIPVDCTALRGKYVRILIKEFISVLNISTAKQATRTVN